MEKDFSNLGVPPQLKLVKMTFNNRELDLLRMSVKGLYSHFYVRRELSGFSKEDDVYALILTELTDLYWKIFNAS